MKSVLLFFFIFFPSFISAEIILDIDTLYIGNSISAKEIDKVYRIEINNNTEYDYLFFISPIECIIKSSSEKFQQFLRQDICDGWRMMNIIYEGNIVYDSKSYSRKNLLKKIHSQGMSIIFVVNNHKLENVLKTISFLKMEDVKTILKADLRNEFLYPFSEAIWPND